MLHLAWVRDIGRKRDEDSQGHSGGQGPAGLLHPPSDGVDALKLMSEMEIGA